MTSWESTWKDILQGGNKRWKVDDPSVKEQALRTILSYCENGKLRILCPLAGDDAFVTTAWQKGHHVTTIDLVPAAVEALRNQFTAGTWSSSTCSTSHTVWNHSSDRAVFYVGDALEGIESLKGTFDVVYDKDSFGALDKSMRLPYSRRMAEYLKPNGILYTEVKNKVDANHRDAGPPFHVEAADLMESFGENDRFEYVASLGQLYDLSMPGMTQMGHILRRLAK